MAIQSWSKVEKSVMKWLLDLVQVQDIVSSPTNNILNVSAPEQGITLPKEGQRKQVRLRAKILKSFYQREFLGLGKTVIAFIIG